jgi:hypothetical protein
MTLQERLAFILIGIFLASALVTLLTIAIGTPAP